MKKIRLVSSVLLISVLSLFACGKNTPALKLEFLSCETDIEGLSVNESGSADNCLDVRIMADSDKEYWFGNEFSVISEETGNEVNKFDKFKFTDEKIVMQKDGTVSIALKQFHMDWFDIKESGEYILRSTVYSGSAEIAGKLDVLVKVTAP